MSPGIGGFEPFVKIGTDRRKGGNGVAQPIPSRGTVGVHMPIMLVGG